MGIYYKDPVFVLESQSSSYVFAIRATGHLEHLYYGERLEGLEGLSGEALYQCLSQPVAFLPGNTIAYSSEAQTLGLELLAQELSTDGKGDLRQPMVAIKQSDGHKTADFIYWSHHIQEGKPATTPSDFYQRLPQAYGSETEVQSLCVTLKDRNSDLELDLHYSLFYETNVLVRSAQLNNKGQAPVQVNKLMSLQLDYLESQMDLIHFSGAWAREMHVTRTAHPGGIWQNSSRAGVSSSRKNPLVILADPSTTESSGRCLGSNLIYSGNHQTTVERGSYGGLRLLVGVEPESLAQTLKPGASMVTPEAVLCYSTAGLNGLSQQFHRFVQNHIVRGPWQKRTRPVLINSWEACYFDFNEAKLLKLAKAAKAVGVELFVLDDGWFGERNDDKSSLGDWQVNLKKLPGGLNGLSAKIKAMGMDFGIWVEPEMVSRDSQLFRAHPEYALFHPDKPHSEGRYQMLLNLAEPKVVDYLFNALSEVLNSGDISYVKWDMNRVVTDVYSPMDHEQGQTALMHRYYLGLYALLEKLQQAFPEVLFEGCASGGNRFDLGMLCYMPQIWASDNTDAYSRLAIQRGYSYGYPPSVMGAHVATAPNHQTLRAMPLATRYHVAAFGLLGYELDLTKQDAKVLSAIKDQICQYKRLRETLQFGRFYRLPGAENSRQQGSEVWYVINEALTQGVLGLFAGPVPANESFTSVLVPHLEPEALYRLRYEAKKLDIRLFGDLINQVSPIPIAQDSLTQHLIAKFYQMDEESFECTASGSILMRSGVKLPQRFCGMGHNEGVSVFTDYSSRLYVIERL